MSGQFVAVAVAFLVTLGLQPFLIRVLGGRGVVDSPNERSSHDVPTPRGGGIGVVAGVLTGAAVMGAEWDVDVWTVLCVAVGLACVGYADDLRGLSPTLRLGAQLVLGGLAGAILAPEGQWWWFLAGAVALWVSAYTNAFNFMDGVNGISGLNAFVVGTSYWFFADAYGQWQVAALSSLLAASGAGFLPFNWLAGRIFLGDVGSYFYGGMVSLTAVLGVLNGIPLLLMLSPLLVYLADTGITLVRRRLAGEEVRTPHRSHVYQQLLSDGWGHSKSTVLTAAGACVSAAGAWFAVQVSWPAGIAVILVTIMGYLSLPLLLRES